MSWSISFVIAHGMLKKNIQLVSHANLKTNLGVRNFIQSKESICAPIFTSNITKRVNYSKGHRAFRQYLDCFCIDQTLAIKNSQRSFISGPFLFIFLTRPVDIARRVVLSKHFGSDKEAEQ